MSGLFFLCQEQLGGSMIGKINISNWDVSNVHSMHGMFYNCYNFNSDLSDWNVSKVADMEEMFFKCKRFNCDLNRWHINPICKLNGIFDFCKSLMIPKWFMLE